MTEVSGPKYYSPPEERINIASHAAGFLLSLLATLFMLEKTMSQGNLLEIISVLAFGVSLMILYAASTSYHLSKKPDLRRKLRVVDHASIYCLIAGTYTPFSLLVLKGSVGWGIFSLSWAMAVIGITLKLFFTGKFSLVSTLMYVFMGWIIVFAIDPLVENLAQNGLVWLVAGGLCYTFGAVLYAIKKIKFNHAIFHLFVLAGSFCHFMSIYLYVI